MTNKRAADNSINPEVAIQWLNQALCFYQSLCLFDSEVLRNRHLRKAAKRYLVPNASQNMLHMEDITGFCSDSIKNPEGKAPHEGDAFEMAIDGWYPAGGVCLLQRNERGTRQTLWLLKE